MLFRLARCCCDIDIAFKDVDSLKGFDEGLEVKSTAGFDVEQSTIAVEDDEDEDDPEVLEQGWPRHDLLKGVFSGAFDQSGISSSSSVLGSEVLFNGIECSADSLP